MFEDPVQYKIEIASGVLSICSKNRLVTTLKMKTSYEQYKDLLYGGKVHLQKLVSDIEARLKKLQAGEDIPKILANLEEN